MNRKITLMDGAVGTSLWNIAEAAGVKKEPVWKYNIEHPEFIEELAKRYVEAGSEIILANTFGANGPAVERVSNYTSREVVAAGVKVAKRALEGTGVKLCMSMGPLTQLLEPYGDLEEEECAAIYEEMLDAGVGAGADIVIVQTFMDLEMMRVATEASKKYGVPVFCSLTFEKHGKTMFGNSVQDAIDTLGPLGIDAIGLNCSLGPDLALPIIREFSEKTDIPLLFKPNAGKPIMNDEGIVTSAYTAAKFAEEVRPALDFVSYIGGCCGSNPEFIKEIKKML